MLLRNSRCYRLPKIIGRVFNNAAREDDTDFGPKASIWTDQTRLETYVQV